MRIVPVLILIISIISSGCSYVYPKASTDSGLRPWVYTDLRALDDADAPAPDQDLLAIYLRTAGSEIQIRLDFMDLAVQSNIDLYLALDTQPGGTRFLPISASSDIDWDTLIMIPNGGPIQAIDSHNQKRHNLAIRVLRDPVLDILTVSLNRSILFGPNSAYRIQVFVSPANLLTLSDRSVVVSSTDPPPQKADVLIAFWDTLPAYTPAQALRRWDGAHTGPLGGRHGLYNLLRNARSHSIPIALLDLKLPLSLSALDYVNGLNLVKDMSARNLLILPDTIPFFPIESPYILPDWMVTKAALDSRDNALAFGLPASPFLSASLSTLTVDADGLRQKSYSLIFCPINSTEPFTLTNITRWGEKKVLFIPVFPQENEQPVQLTPDGPSLDLKHALIRAALSNNIPNNDVHPSILVLGGDLPQTEWGDPGSVRTAMDYLAAHPWIQILDAYDLLSEPTSNWRSTLQPSSSKKLPDSLNELMIGLNYAPKNPLGAAAWQAALALFAPVSPSSPNLAELRSQYVGQVKTLLAAAIWAENPFPVTKCIISSDLDGGPACIFASKNFYTLINLEDGSLTYAFAITRNGIHQIIGPTSQFATGFGDPAAWDFSRGLLTDPTVIPGAFADGKGPYKAEIRGNSLILTADNGTQKLFTLEPDGVRLDIQSEEPSNYQLPLALDPWIRFNPDWAAQYRGIQLSNSWVWSVSSTITVKILTSGQISNYEFTDTLDRMGIEEDPNFDYPPGHFLVFPVAVAEIQSQGNFSVEIRTQPDTAQ
jgi:hypothetical protein